MSQPLDTDVLIVGAGPVGMTLAMCLAQRQVRSVIIEMKAAEAAPEIKCNHISARSMEVFRRLGVANDLRASGLPDDYPHDVSYRTSTVGQEISGVNGADFSVPGAAAVSAAAGRSGRRPRRSISSVSSSTSNSAGKRNH